MTDTDPTVGEYVDMFTRHSGRRPAAGDLHDRESAAASSAGGWRDDSDAGPHTLTDAEYEANVDQFRNPPPRGVRSESGIGYRHPDYEWNGDNSERNY